MRKKIFYFIWAAVFLAGIVQTLFYASHLSGYMEGDPATVALMARDALEGRFHVFFYGQDYNGTLEALWLAPFVYLFGLKVFSVFLGMICLYCVFLVTLYFLGRKVAGRRVGLMAMAYCAISPFPLLRNSIYPYGYHLPALVLGSIVLILALHLDEEDPPWWKWALLGLAGGLGFWNHMIILYYLVPAAALLLLRRDCLRRWASYPVAAAFFFLGSLPFWVHNFRTGFSSFFIHKTWSYKEHYSFSTTTLLVAAKRFFHYHMSGIMGVDISTALGIVLWAVFIAAIAVFLFRMNRKKMLIVFLFLSITGIGLTQRFFVMSGRYSYFIHLYIPVAVFFAGLAAWFDHRVRHSGKILILILLLLNLDDFVISASEWKPEAGDHRSHLSQVAAFKSLVRFLELKKIDGVIAEYEIAQAVNLMTERKISAAEPVDSQSPFDEDVQAADNMAFVNLHGRMEPSLPLVCAGYQLAGVPLYSILYDFRKRPYEGVSLSPDGWKAGGCSRSSLSSYSFDRGLDHRWIADARSSGKLIYEVDLGKEHEIFKIEMYNIRPYGSGHPASFDLKTSPDGKEWKLIHSAARSLPLFWSGPVLYWNESNGRRQITFEPVKARYIRLERLEGGEENWSINELFVFERTAEKPFSAGDYEKAARELYSDLERAGVRFSYAGFWLSGKIRKWSLGRIDVVRMRNKMHPFRSGTDRMMTLDKNTAIIIEKEAGPEMESLLSGLELKADRKAYGPFICYRIMAFSGWEKYFMEKQNVLYWTGLCPVRKNIALLSELYAGYAAGLERAGRDEEAERYYRKALDVSPGYYLAAGRLAELSRRRGAEDLYRHWQQHEAFFSPETKKKVRFKGGIIFEGMTVHRFRDRLQVKFFWELSEKLEDRSIHVFVHFLKDDKIIFQGDHPLLYGFSRPVVPVAGYFFTERFAVDLPPGLEKGPYTVSIGLYLPEKSDKRIRILEEDGTAADIGDIRLGR